MHKIKELKDMLCDELEEYGGKDSLSAADLDIVDKLAHTVKNLDKILGESEGYSMDGYSRRYSGGRSYDRSYDGDYSGDDSSGDYSGRRGRGANAKRDSMGRYSGAHTPIMINDLRNLMQKAPDEETRKEFERFIQRIETM